jgi:hypothetical protein
LLAQQLLYLFERDGRIFVDIDVIHIILGLIILGFIVFILACDTSPDPGLRCFHSHSV